MRRGLRVALLVAMLAAGCATPQAALDQANHGAVLVTSFRLELENSRKVQAEVASARLTSIRMIEREMAEHQSAAAFDERLLLLAGKSDAVALEERIRELSDSRAVGESARNRALAELNAKYDGLLTWPPNVADKLSATERALAALGVELPPEERLAMVASFTSEIRETVSENERKIEQARNEKQARDEADTDSDQAAGLD